MSRFDIRFTIIVKEVSTLTVRTFLLEIIVSKKGINVYIKFCNEQWLKLFLLTELAKSHKYVRIHLNCLQEGISSIMPFYNSFIIIKLLE